MIPPAHAALAFKNWNSHRWLARRQWWDGWRVPAALLTALWVTGCASHPGRVSTTNERQEDEVLGQLRYRAASEIASSSWSVGGETLDRYYASYAAYRAYLGPLGAKWIRVQAGWARTEGVKRVYDWAWLDEVVDDAHAQGVAPWLQLGYGNPNYPGGGDTTLGGGLPSSEEALAAWDRWARAAVERYRDRVTVWEIWNEPDINSAGLAPVARYVELYDRTARMIRELQPQSRIVALSLAGKMDYAEQFLSGMAELNRLHLIDEISVHGYPRNPDDTSNIDALRGIIDRFDPRIAIRQGESGAPSQLQHQFALRGFSWTENLQAKWNLRRMLAHHAKDIPTSLFTMVDLHYTHYHREQDNGALRMNYKGLLATNPDQTVARAKPAYHAARAVFSIFDHSLQRIPDFPFTTTALRRLALSAYAPAQGAGQVVAVWFNDAPPDDGNERTRIQLTLPNGRFTEPVLVDLLTGKVHALAPGAWRNTEAGVEFLDLPVYDAPILVAERALIPLASAR